MNTMKSLILALLFSCGLLEAATIHVTIAIPQLGVTNADAFIVGLGTKTSEYPNSATPQTNWLFLVAVPGNPGSNFNITYQQLTNALALGIIPPFVGNGAGFTNLLLSSFVSPTNGVASATAIDYNVPEATTNITANIAFTSIINANSTNYNYAIRHIINNSGGNLTLTTGTGWRTDPILRTSATTYTITNNTCVDLLVGAQINFFTNANIAISSQ